MRRGYWVAAVVASCAKGGATTGAPAGAIPTSTATATPTPTPTPTLYVRARSLPIHVDATLKGKWIGLLVAGDSVALLDEPPRSSTGCASVRAIQPRGWVCADNPNATLDATDPVWLELRAHAPDYASPWPYFYGESRGARLHKSLPGVPGPLWPATLIDPRAAIAARSTLAWTDEVDAEGTTWLRASDMSFVRKDRITPFARADFHGVALGGEVKLPLAFFKRAPHAKYRRDSGGRLIATDAAWPRLSWTALTGRTEMHGAVTYWESREEDAWLDAREAAIVSPERARAPEGEDVDHGRRTSIEIAALQGWLVAYEDATPVYATMVSAGKLGAAKPDPGRGLQQPAATTPLGTFRIKEKLLTTTLQSDLDDGTEFVHAEVPWSQRFYDKYLLHTAYWHDEWGEGRSGGCVNLSPIDAKWLFAWTQPELPQGWHAVRAGDEGGTVVVIHP